MISLIAVLVAGVAVAISIHSVRASRYLHRRYEGLLEQVFDDHARIIVLQQQAAKGKTETEKHNARTEYSKEYCDLIEKRLHTIEKHLWEKEVDNE